MTQVSSSKKLLRDRNIAVQNTTCQEVERHIRILFIFNCLETPVGLTLATVLANMIQKIADSWREG